MPKEQIKEQPNEQLKEQVSRELSAQGVPIPGHWRRIIVAVWSGQAVSLLTSGAAGYALIWYLVESTESPFILSLGTIMFFIPMAVLSPLAGTIADRYNRKYIMIIADMFIALFAVIAALVIFLGFASVPLVLALLLLRSVGTAFHAPAMQAVMPLLVPDRHLVRITSLDQGLQGAANIVAPAIGIFFYAAFGMYVALLLDTIGALVACGLLAIVKIPKLHMKKEQRTGMINEFKDGLQAVREVRGMGLLFVLIGVGVMAFMPMASLFTLMTYRHFGGDGYQAALVEAVWGAGFLLGSLIIGVWGGGKRLIVVVMLSVLLQGAFTVVMGLLPGDAFAIFVMICIPQAISGAFFNGPINAIVQRRIAPEKLGRTMALMGTVMYVAGPLGLFLAGPVAELTGVPFWFVASGLALVVVALGGMLFPSVRQIDRLPDVS